MNPLKAVVSLFRNTTPQPEATLNVIPMKNSRSKTAPVVTEFDTDKIATDLVVPVSYLKDTLTPSHCASVLRREFWWTLIGNGDAFTKTGDASAFWLLVRAIGEEPLGFTQGVNPYTGREQSTPISDPMVVARNILERARMTDRKLMRVEPQDVVNVARDRKITPEALAQMMNAERDVKIAQAKVAEETSLRLIAAAGNDQPYSGNDYHIPKKRCLETMLSTRIFGANRIKDVLFAEAESILWNDEISKVAKLYVKTDTVLKSEDEDTPLFDKSANF